MKKNTCTPPRQREGKSYPGGKRLRKAHERLAARRQACEGTRVELRRRPKSVPESAYRMPGSMK
jgi:hypothetical protein